MTENGKIVWEFYNPITKQLPSEGGPSMMRAAIYRMERIGQK